MPSRPTLEIHEYMPRDLARLAEMNAALIRDEGHSNSMGLPALEARMRGWLEGEYAAVLFRDGDAAIGYALYRAADRDESSESNDVYLRQFFVEPSQRRTGIGREAFERLRTEVWPSGSRITLEALVGNAPGRAFWLAVGMREYAVTYELRGSG